MEPPIAGEFACAACGRKYRWSSHTAGDAVHCECGAVLQVPQQPTEATVNSLPHADFPPAAQEYRRHDASVADDCADPIHDTYLPAALLIMALLAVFTWIFCQGGWGPRASIVVAGLMAGAILIKVVILGLVAWRLSSLSGSGFSSAATLILKLAALAVLLDAVYLWLRVAMGATGMMYARGIGMGVGRGRLTLELIVLTFVALIVPRFLYNMDDDEAFNFGCLTGVINVIANIALVLALAAAVHFFGK
jgi:hypothetical protein